MDDISPPKPKRTRNWKSGLPPRKQSTPKGARKITFEDDAVPEAAYAAVAAQGVVAAEASAELSPLGMETAQEQQQQQRLQEVVEKEDGHKANITANDASKASKGTTHPPQPPPPQRRIGLFDRLTCCLVPSRSRKSAPSADQLEAKEMLDQALVGSDTQELEMAIAEGKAVRLNEDDLAEASKRLAQLQEARRAAAVDHFQHALQSGKAELVKAAIEEADAAGVNPEVIREAREAFAEMEDKANRRRLFQRVPDESEQQSEASNDGNLM